MELAKAKIASVALANEKMEELRNMPYDSLATKAGAIYPPGNILDEETIEEKGIRFRVDTVISYIDDPYDGCADVHVDGVIDSICLQNMPAGKPKDIYPYDYKKAEITVTKIGRNSYLTRLSSTFSAKAAETATNSGIIKLCVVDATGAPVSEADISIERVSPIVDIHAKTGLDGCIMVPNLPPSTQNDYHLVATKNGYSTSMTYPRTAQNPNALFPDVDVSIQQVTPQTLTIDKVSKMIIDVVDKINQPLAGGVLHIQGAKEMYFNPSTLKYSNDLVLDVNGHIEIPNLEFDDYSFSIQGKTIVSVSPYQPVGLAPDTTLNVKIVVSDSASDIIISSCEPISGKPGETAYLTVKGENFENGAIVKIVFPPNSKEIVATDVVVSQRKTIEADLNLSEADIGAWDLIITNPDGGSVTQQKGFEVKL